MRLEEVTNVTQQGTGEYKYWHQQTMEGLSHRFDNPHAMGDSAYTRNVRPGTNVHSSR